MAKLSNDRLDKFRPQTRNANRHTQRGMGALEAAMRKYGYVAPMTAAADGEILDGSARIETSANVFGDDVIVVHHDGTKPVIMVRDDIPSGDTPQAREISIAANRIAQFNLDFDAEVILGDLQAGVDLEQFWRKDELDELLADLQPKATEGDTPAETDRAEELRQKWGTAAGQLWQLGEHRLVCGDCTDAATVARVMGGEKAALCVTDPPYNVAIVGGTHDPRDTKNYGKGPRIENDSMTDAEFDAFLYAVFVAMSDAMADGAAYYVCAPAGRTETQFRNALDKVFTLRQCIVWVKQQAVFGRQDYHWRHESILYGWKDGAAHYFVDDHTQNTVWEIDRPMRSDKEHPTQKPVELFEKMLANSSVTNAIVYEPFSGSGTTIIACENLARRCRAVEISPAYVAVALERWATHTGKTPVLLESGAPVIQELAGHGRA